jgi:PhzF family phenazine biosynthesis protein
MSGHIPIFQVDAFAERPFEGNPAAVCLLPNEREADWMLSVAAEMNLAETAFLVSREEAYDLRWFTPTVEVDLCGHATLASAHVLWETGHLASGETARFQTRSGLLTASRIDGWIDLDLPSEPAHPIEIPRDLEQALGMRCEWVGRNRMDYLVLLNSEAAVRGLIPDLSAVARLDCRGLIVTAASESGKYDYVSRFFAPQSGINEDPVTGSAHCALAPFWTERFGRTHLVGYQASKRGGTVRTILQDDRAILRGQAITIMNGSLKA